MALQLLGSRQPGRHLPSQSLLEQAIQSSSTVCIRSSLHIAKRKAQPNLFCSQSPTLLWYIVLNFTLELHTSSGDACMQTCRSSDAMTGTRLQSLLHGVQLTQICSFKHISAFANKPLSAFNPHVRPGLPWSSRSTIGRGDQSILVNMHRYISAMVAWLPDTNAPSKGPFD